MSDLRRWLDSPGLSRYAGVLAENDIDMAVLPEPSDGKPKEIGFSLGHRKNLLDAIVEARQRAQPDPPARGRETTPPRAVPTRTLTATRLRTQSTGISPDLRSPTR